MSRLKVNTLIPLNIAILTISNSRTIEQDTSGDALLECLQVSGHTLAERVLCKGDVYQIRAHVSHWVASEHVQVILINGGTGLTQDDVTIEAITPLFDKPIEGFGELFRQLSYQQIGTSTLQSRAIAGFANQTLIAAMPGSTNACLSAWDEILQPQLDARVGPCNFVPNIKNSQYHACATREQKP